MTTLPPRSESGSTTGIVASLLDALLCEGRLLREMATVLQRQRCALAVADMPTVEDTVFSIHRVLHTLGAARERRRGINRMLGEPDDLAIGELELALGKKMTDDLREARDSLATSAEELTGELETTWQAIREAVAREKSIRSRAP